MSNLITCMSISDWDDNIILTAIKTNFIHCRVMYSMMHPVVSHTASLQNLGAAGQIVTCPDFNGIPRTHNANDYQVCVIRSLLTGEPMFRTGIYIYVTFLMYNMIA